MKVLLSVALAIFSLSAFAESERELVLAVKTKEVVAAFRDKKDLKTKNTVILEFVKSLKPLCKEVAKVKWGDIPESELKKLGGTVGEFIAGLDDYQIKMNSDENAKLTVSDRAEIKRVCKEIEKHSLN